MATEPPFDSVLSDSDRPPRTNGPPLDSIEVVYDDRSPHPFLHCMPCGATFGLHWSPLTVDTIVHCAQAHVPHCIGHDMELVGDDDDGSAVPVCLICGEPGRILCEEHR